MSARVLLVDDLRSFREPVEGVDVARTVAEALAALADGGTWDQIWLDHDLGEATGRIEDVMPIVDDLVERALNDKPVAVETIVLHTSNPVGRTNIERALTRAGYRIVHVRADDYLVAATSGPAVGA
jgi:hypothetical protein